jgi:DNA repair protein RadD
MTLVPHPHQVDMLNDTRAAFRDHQAIILQSPTGSGKTVLGTLVALGAAGKGRRVMFTVHRDFLVEQTSSAFNAVALNHGIIAAGYAHNPREMVQIAAIDTLKNRLDRVKRPDLLIVDEGHHSVAAGWAKVIRQYMEAGTKVLCLTATPIRLDGVGLSEVGYSHMVRGPTVRFLIENGFLSDYEAYAPSTADMSAVHSRMGDYIKSEAEAEVDKPTITGDAIREYSAKAPGKRAVVFCISVKHSQHVCEQFNAAGIRAAHIDGTTDKVERKRLLNQFRRGEVLVLTSVDIFGEGFDLPSVEVAILLRPTQSLSLHLQQIGRALRVSPGKEKAVILDHVGNLMRLGLPDTEFEWSLEGREKRKGKKKDEDAMDIRQCESCYSVYSPAGPVCPSCGFVHETVIREITHVEGDLHKIDKATMQAMKAERKAADAEAKRIQREADHAASQAVKARIRKARTLEDLQVIQREKGYRPGWAEHTLRTREEARDRVGQRIAESQAQAFLRR